MVISLFPCRHEILHVENGDVMEIKTIITRTYKRELIYPTFDAHGTEGWKAVLENMGFLPRAVLRGPCSLKFVPGRKMILTSINSLVDVPHTTRRTRNTAMAECAEILQFR
jgi:hypothetical protein